MLNSKKRFILSVVFILIFFSVVGCSAFKFKPNGSNESVQNDKEIVTLSFLHKWPQPEYMPYFEEVIEAFEKENPNIKVQMQAIEDEAIKDKLRVLMVSKERPDIFFTWSGEFAEKFIRSGNAYDLTEVLNTDSKWKDGFMVAGLEPFESDGKNYGVPFRINGKFFVYNKKIFQSLGLEKPQTWDRLIEICQAVKNSGKIPIAFGNKFPWAGCHYITGLNQKLVPDQIRLRDYDPRYGEFTHEGYIEALNYIKELNDKKFFNDDVNSIDHHQAYQLFADGKASMIYVELEEFQKVENSLAGEWGFFPLPEMPNERGSKNFLTGAPDGFMISANTKHPVEAEAFLKFLTSKPMADKLVQMLGWPSPVKGAVSIENNGIPALIKGMEGVEHAEGMALWLDTDIHIKISDVYLPGIQELLEEHKTPEEIMEDVRSKAKEVKDEINAVF